MRVLLTGGFGLLGQYLRPALAGNDTVCVARSDRHPGATVMDLVNRDDVFSGVAALRPDIVVHAAALADVDACETDRDRAYRENVAATRNLVDAVDRYVGGSRFVYVSTDQVYSGPGPHREDNPVPVNTYSRTKLWGEDIVCRLDQSLVLRLNFVGRRSRDRSGFAEWVISSLASRQPMRLFDDVLFNPLHGAKVAETIVELVASRVSGTFNLGCDGNGLSKAEFALGIARRLKLSTSAATICSIDDGHLAAPRPRDTRLNMERLKGVLKRPLPDVEAMLDQVADEWLRTKAEAT